MSHQQPFKREKIKAIILAGSRDFRRCPLASRLPTALWPVVGESVLERLLVHLVKQGIGRAVICSNGDLGRGQIACASGDCPDVSETIEAVVFWMSDQALQKGDMLDFKCATMQTSCQVKEIADRLDSSTLEPVTDTNNQLRDTEIAKLTIQMDRCVATDPFEKVAETGRFVLMRDNDTVAGGVLHEETKTVR